jgi:exopolysaccharide biosynthesis polyprenyl glycosylphosphotransferase
MLRSTKRPISLQAFCLVLIDLLIFLLSFGLAALIRFGFRGLPRYICERWPALILVLPLFVLTLYVADLYQTKKDYRGGREALRIGIATLSAILSSVFILYLAFYGRWQTFLGRGILSLFGLFVFTGVLLSRWYYSQQRSRGAFTKRVILVVDPVEPDRILPLIRQIKTDVDLELVGLVSLEGPNPAIEWEASVLGEASELCRIVEQEKPDVLVVALSSDRFGPLIRNLVNLSHKGIEIRDAIGFSEEYFKRIPIQFIDDLWFLISYINLPRIHVHRIKRLMDVLISILGLLLTLPLSLVIAIAIKLESRGSIFFLQERIGKDGHPFRLIKFRSMIQGAEEATGPVWATMDDPRVTRVGRFLRRWRLDEIPQLWNVLRGEMSLVGPRPERREFLEELKTKVPYFMERLSVKPGITGWAQIESSYASSVEESQIKLEFDLYYIKNISFLLDLSILFRTLRVVLAARGR